MPARFKTVITISRQMASGGAYVGHLLARQLGYKYIEREVLVRAAEELGVDIAEVSKQDERRSGFVENIMKSFLFGTPEAAYVPPSRKPIYDYDLFIAESKIIQTIAERHDCVIVGRGGYWILRDRPRTAHIFLHAPLDFRVKRLQMFHQLSKAGAREEIEDSDRRREKFLKTMTASDWHDANNYHLAIDTATAGFETARKMIIELIDRIKHI